MTPKIKGYALTYLGWITGNILALAAVYAVAGDLFQRFTDGEQSESIFEILIRDGFASIIAIAAGLTVYYVVTVVACPLATYLLLFHTHNKVAKTALFLLGFLILSPIFLSLNILTDFPGNAAFYLTILWLLITPFLARYYAARSTKPAV